MNTRRHLIAGDPEECCPECGGLLDGAGDCEFCATVDAILAENPRGPDFQQFVEALT